MMSPAQIVVVLCLTTLDEGTLPLSGRELEGVVARRRAQMTFIREKAAALGQQEAVDDDDWAVANAWLQEMLPLGYQPAARPLFAELMATLPRPTLRKALEVVSAVIQWDGVTTEAELALLDDLARAAKMNDHATLEDLRRIGARLACA